MNYQTNEQLSEMRLNAMNDYSCAGKPRVR